MFEHRRQPLISRSEFLRRLGRNAIFALGLLVVSLGIGTIGYHWLAGLGWLDATHNAAMVLTAMGPVDRMQATAGKVFETCYAVFSGVIFLTMFAILVAPVAHRVLHRFHLEEESEADSPPARGR